MHKTLYIDVDEEITSIIDRVRKADVREVIVVSPKNSLLLQSVVNLRLLKKEADRRKKHLMIVTQDKIGKKLIEKAGIAVQSKPGDDLYLENDEKKTAYEPLYKEEASEIRKELQREEAEEKTIGTSEYFEEKPAGEEIAGEREVLPPGQPMGKIEKKISAVSNNQTKGNLNSKVKMSDIIAGRPKSKLKKQKKLSGSEQVPINYFKLKPISQAEKTDSFLESDDNRNDHLHFRKSGNVSIKKAEKFFRGSRRRKKEFETAKISGSTKKYFAVFAAVFVMLAGLSTAYFLLPSTTLVLQLKNQEVPVSLSLTADAQLQNTNSAENTIPASLEQLSREITNEFNASGSKDGAGKASGKAVVYNEFSAQDQPLVATTRLETEDGKIFRITKNIVVPGMTQVGSETKPGAIEVDVVADQPGENFNIGPASFKIPGFQNNQAKYEKFYAKSAKSMEGGNSQGLVKEISAQDVTNAKEKITLEAKKSVIEEMKKNLPAGRNIFDDAAQIEVLGMTTSNNAGAEKEKFTANIKVRASALSFLESDVQEIMQSNLSQQGVMAGQVLFDKPIDYLLESFDNQKKNLKFEAKASVKTSPDFNLDNFKQGILGKNTEEAQAYAKSFPEIQKMDIAFWPFFVSRIPMNEGRVEIEIK